MRYSDGWSSRAIILSMPRVIVAKLFPLRGGTLARFCEKDLEVVFEAMDWRLGGVSGPALLRPGESIDLRLGLSVSAAG